MRVFALSDFHLSLTVDKPMDKFGSAWEGQLERVKENTDRLMTDDDILLIAGDISWAMSEAQAQADIDFLSTLRGKKVLIRGNHDYWWSTISKVRRLLCPDMYAVHNDAIRIGSFVICGNRGVLTSDKPQSDPDGLLQKHYEREIQRYELSLKAMNDLRKEGDKCIFMTHYPPFNSQREPNEFTKMLEEARVDAVVYGHIHRKHLKNPPSKSFLTTTLNGISYYLTSSDLLTHCPTQIF